VADHHAPGLGQRLQARRQVRHIADDRFLARCALANQVAHDHLASRDAHARPEARLRQRGQAAHALDQLKSGAHRPLSIVLVGLRPAEVGEHAIAQELGDVPFEPADDLRAGRLICPHDVAQVLGVEPGGELGRADQVAEQHGQLAAFGLDRPHRRPARLHGSRHRAIVKCGDRVEQPAPVPDRGDPKGDQILGGQPRQHLGVDIVGAERLGVLLQAQIPQPARDVHLRRSG
jgi:hypothetical protein